MYRCSRFFRVPNESAKKSAQQSYGKTPMKPNPNVIVTPALLRELIDYHPDTGKMFWKKRRDSLFSDPTSAMLWNIDNAGKEIFIKPTKGGYRGGVIFGKSLFSHRIAWAITHGTWPENLIDHINGIKTDNRIVNLRDATPRINARNSAMNSTNKSGYVGVSETKTGKFKAVMMQRHLGTFDKFEDAVEARKAAQREAPAFTERHGKPKIKVYRGHRNRRFFQFNIKDTGAPL
jgi:HNH endonuclease